MINGYGIFLICWLFIGFASSVYHSHNATNPVVSCIAYSARFAAMVWLIFQI